MINNQKQHKGAQQTVQIPTGRGLQHPMHEISLVWLQQEY